MREPDVISLWGPANGPRPVVDDGLDDFLADATVTESRSTQSDLATIWALITNPTRIGDFSPECFLGEWIEGSTTAEVGARFQGSNQITQPDGKVFQWTRPCTVTVYEPMSRYAYQASDRWDVPASEWTFELKKLGNGTKVSHTFRHLPSGLTGLRMGWADVNPEDRAQQLEDRLAVISEGMQTTLERIARAAS
jgi:Activator of Hsp90 ATPase homolog 1-like protein